MQDRDKTKTKKSPNACGTLVITAITKTLLGILNFKMDPVILMPSLPYIYSLTKAQKFG